MAANVGFMYSTDLTSDSLSSGAFTVSSESASFPKQNIQDVYTGKPFKFAVVADGGGLFRISTGNQDIRIKDNTSLVTHTFQATPANLTGTTLASALETLINAYSGFSGYTVTYSVSTGKFTFACAVGNFELKWATVGANSMGGTLGFGSASLTGAATYTGDEVRVHSEGFLEIDLGSAQSPTGFFFVGTNFSTSATIRLYSSAATMIGAISTADSVREHFDGAGTLEKAFTAGTDFLTDDFNDVGFVEFAPATARQFWTLYYADPTPRESRLNHEFGRLAIGTITKPTRAWAQPYQTNIVDPSPQSDTFGGLLTGQSFPMVRSTIVSWVSIESADKETLEQLYRNRPAPLLLSADTTLGATQSMYCQIVAPSTLIAQTAEPSRWTISSINFRQVPRRQVS